jgi:hypothetical protein
MDVSDASGRQECANKVIDNFDMLFLHKYGSNVVEKVIVMLRLMLGGGCRIF